MRKVRWITFTAVTAVMAGSLVYTLGYAWYYRSAAYRRHSSAALTEALDLPAEIGRVIPRSWSSREYRDVTVWLPDRRARVFHCEDAVVRYAPTAENPEDYEIDLRGGFAEISPRTWLRQDYRTVIESGLRPGFSPDGPRRVRFSGMNLGVVRDEFRLALRDASGTLWFEGTERGHADIACHEFNGLRLYRPVFLTTQFSPENGGVVIDELVLKVPRITLAAARLNELLHTPVQSGSFEGRLEYGENPAGGRVLTVSGRCFDLDLAEWTAGFYAQPWRGRAPEIALDELRVENEVPVRIRFGGVLADVRLGDVLAAAGLPGVTGRATLRVREAELSRRGIERFVASGECEGVSLESLTAAVGRGQMTGDLRLRIEDLTIEDNRLARLDAEVLVADAVEQPNWIDTALLREVLTAQPAGAPPLIPSPLVRELLTRGLDALDRIEYTKLGVRLDVRDEQLRVFGTHGERQKDMITLRVFGRDLPIRELDASFDLTERFDSVRARGLHELDLRLRQLQTLRESPPAGSIPAPDPQSP